VTAALFKFSGGSVFDLVFMENRIIQKFYFCNTLFKIYFLGFAFSGFWGQWRWSWNLKGAPSRTPPKVYGEGETLP
jgi:hypothetical protein